MSGKCPGCGVFIESVKIESVRADASKSQALSGAAFLCPHCSVILSVQIDPIALNEDFVSDVVKGVVSAMRKLL